MPRGIIFIDFLEKRQTINSEHYVALDVRLTDEIVKDSKLDRRLIEWCDKDIVEKNESSQTYFLDYRPF